MWLRHVLSTESNVLWSSLLWLQFCVILCGRVELWMRAAGLTLTSADQISFGMPFRKTEAESKALEYAKTSGLDLVTICTSFVWGPMLQSTLNTTSLYLLDFFKEHESLEIMVETVVDVRDVAAAILMVYERPEARGRYLCNAFNVKGHQVVDKLKTLYPQYKYPNNIIGNEDMIMASSEKLERLGWTYRPLEETIVDSVECYYNRGLLP